MTSKTIERAHEDIDEKALSYAEIKALASGNPLIIEKTELDTEVSKLKLLKQSYLSQIYELEDAMVKYYPVEIKKNTELIENIEKDIAIVKEDTKNDNEEKFSPMILNGKIYYKKEDAGKKLLEICNNKTNTEQQEIGEYRGMRMFLEIDAFEKEFKIKLINNSIYPVKLGNDVYGNITRIDNVLNDMEKVLIDTKIKLENLNKQFENAKNDVKIPFDKEEMLQQKIERLSEVNKELEIKDSDDEILEDEELDEEKEVFFENTENDKEPVR